MTPNKPKKLRWLTLKASCLLPAVQRARRLTDERLAECVNYPPAEAGGLQARTSSRLISLSPSRPQVTEASEAYVYSPRLAHSEQAADFKMEIGEEDSAGP
jgi:hypothetical protein